MIEREGEMMEHAVPAYIPNGGPIIGWVLYEKPNSTATEVIPCCTRYEINSICYSNRRMNSVRVQLRSLMPKVPS